jgi:hypothetical protein
LIPWDWHLLDIAALFLHSKAHTTLLASRLALHFFADFNVDFEKLGGATIQTNRFTLVEIAFPVVWRNAFLGTRLSQAVPRGSIIERTCKGPVGCMNGTGGDERPTGRTYPIPFQLPFLQRQSFAQRRAVNDHRRGKTSSMDESEREEWIIQIKRLTEGLKKIT